MTMTLIFRQVHAGKEFYEDVPDSFSPWELLKLAPPALWDKGSLGFQEGECECCLPVVRAKGLKWNTVVNEEGRRYVCTGKEHFFDAFRREGSTLEQGYVTPCDCH